MNTTFVEAVEAVGRVGNGEKKQSFLLSTGNNESILLCIGSDGYNISVNIGDILSSYTNKKRISIQHPT